MTPISKQHNQISPHIHQKMRKRCRNDYIEAFGAVYWAKKKLFKKFLGSCNNPLRRTRVKSQTLERKGLMILKSVSRILLAIGQYYHFLNRTNIPIWAIRLQYYVQVLSKRYSFWDSKYVFSPHNSTSINGNQFWLHETNFVLTCDHFIHN